MADKSLLLPVGIPQNISIILSDCISDELFSSYQGNQTRITRKNHFFCSCIPGLPEQPQKMDLSPEQSVPSQGDMDLSGGMSARGARNITSHPSLCCGVCSTGRTQGLWIPLDFLKSMRGSRRQALMRKTDHPQMAAVRKQSL